LGATNGRLLVATEVGTAYVRILPSTVGFQAALGGQMTAGAATSGKAAGAALGGGVLAGAARFAAPLAAIFGATQIVSFAGDSIAEASDLNESLNAVKVTFGDNADAVKALGQQSADTLGLSNREFNDLAVRFSAFSKIIAGDGGNVAGTLDDLTTRAADFASVMNLDVAEAAALFQSGLAGETEPLRRFGIDLSAAAVQAFAYANGIAEQGQPLTEAQKVQARYLSLLSQTSQTQGDFANTSGELANQQRILASRFANLRATIGEFALPAVTGVVGFANDVVGGLLGLGDTGKALGPFADVVERLRPAFTGLRDSLSGLGSAFGELWTAAQPFIQAVVERLAPLIGGLFEGLVARLQGAIEVVSGIFDVLTGIITGDTEKIRDGVEKIWEGIKTAVIGTVKGLWEGIVGAFTGGADSIGETVTGLGPRLGEWWAGAWRAAGDAVKRGVEALLEFVAAIPGQVLGFLIDLPGQLFDFFSEAFTRTVDAAKVVVPQLIDYLRELPGKVVEAVGDIAPRMFEIGQNIVVGLIDGIKDYASWAIDQAQEFVGNVVDGIKGALGMASPSKVFADIGGNAVAGFVQGLDQPGEIRRAVSRMTKPATASITASRTGAAAGAASAGSQVSNVYQFGDIRGVSMEEALRYADRRRRLVNLAS
jgi:hypothetical protein